MNTATSSYSYGYKFNGLNISEDGTIGNGVRFQRIRRVTGYLTGDLSRFNNGKKAEERDRVKHMHV
ncbi:anaerobic ribonucleoside-triphosphate reductase [uncultured Succinivibrio sp.]|uniref:anaerobic ribonucleoside-triphosphate reductase n=1 Tax=uncultured Succinivibrio sp. TaxID=540749 RepID=UPI0025EFB6D5|nr:anaerobic ribonucleoside-triphosphate reductase [uncultured Succinivibrio sp.]